MTRSTIVASLLGAASLLASGAAAQHHEGITPLDSIAAAILEVEDLDQAKAFYMGTFGMTVMREVSTDEIEEAVLATQDTAGTKLVLVESLGEDAPPVRPTRVVFFSPNAAAAVAALKAQDLEIVREATPIAEGSPVVIGIARDPDGHALEFIERPAP